MSNKTNSLWEELHLRALTFKGVNDGYFIRRWSYKVSQITGGCKCGSFWKRWIKYNPPVYSPPESYFEWTVKAHNSVNLKLNKPLITVSKAKEIYTSLL